MIIGTPATICFGELACMFLYAIVVVRSQNPIEECRYNGLDMHEKGYHLVSVAYFLFRVDLYETMFHRVWRYYAHPEWLLLGWSKWGDRL